MQDSETKDKLNAHYKNCALEPLPIMEKILTKEEYIGFIKGNIIKYRLRAGYKDNAIDDIQKALYYEDIYKGIKENNNVSM